MRKHIRILLLILVVAAVIPFVYPWKDGKPLLSWSDIRLPQGPAIELPELPEMALPGKEDSPRAPHQPVKLYRWQDAEGGIQFSNELPPVGVTFEIVEVNPEANLIQAQPVNREDGSESATLIDDSASQTRLPSPLTVSPGEAVQLYEDAHEIREISEQRLRQQEELLK